MAAHVVRDKRIYPRHGDAIRVVPLHLPDALKTPPADAVAAAASPPQLTYRGGPLISSVEIFTVFWGAAWQTTQAPLAKQINGFFDFILTSPLIDQLAEYNLGPYNIGHGKRTGTITITTPELHKSVSDTAIQHMLQTEISSNHAVPPPSPDTDAPAAWRSLMRLPRPHRTNCAKQSPTPFQGRAGTTMPMARLATSARGKPRRSGHIRFSWSGPTNRTIAFMGGVACRH